MKLHLHLLGTSLLASALLSASVTAAESEHSFSVHNKSKVAITKILVSEDGKTYGEFDIGKGIPSGDSMDLVWDASTDNEECKQYIKAVYAGGDESEPTIFDFCESELTLEFE